MLADPLRLLVLEDSDADYLLVERRVRQRYPAASFQRVWTSEAFAAAVDQAAFDAVLSDLSMPVLSGAALGRRMLDVRPDLPIVLFTGYAAELGPDEVRTAGFRAILHKPMTAAALAEALHRVLPAPAGA